MGIGALVLGGIELVTQLVSATARLRKAEREGDEAAQPPAYPGTRPQLPRPVPPPPLGHSGYPEALAYVSGRDDANREREEQERAKAALKDFARQAAHPDDAGEPEKPTEGETP